MRIAIVFLGFVLLWAGLTPPRAQAQATEPYSALLDQADDLLEADKPERAQQKAEEAIKLKPAQHDAYFLAGVAAYRQDSLDVAEEFLQQALNRAPVAKRKLYSETLKVVGNKRTFLAKLAIADKAEADGLFAKAAREFTAAWEAFPAREDIGMRAARLWGQRLNSPLEAAGILYVITSEGKDQAQVEQARELLNGFSAALDALYSQQLAEGRAALEGSDTEKALTALTLASRAKPGEAEPGALMLRIHARSGDSAKAMEAVKSIIKAGPLDVEKTFGNVDVLPLLEEQTFLTFLTDVSGPQLPTLARSAATKELNRQQAEAKQKQQEAEALRAEQLRRAEVARRQIELRNQIAEADDIEDADERWKRLEELKRLYPRDRQVASSYDDARTNLIRVRIAEAMQQGDSTQRLESMLELRRQFPDDLSVVTAVDTAEQYFINAEIALAWEMPDAAARTRVLEALQTKFPRSSAIQQALREEDLATALPKLVAGVKDERALYELNGETTYNSIGEYTSHRSHKLRLEINGFSSGTSSEWGKEYKFWDRRLYYDGPSFGSSGSQEAQAYWEKLILKAKAALGKDWTFQETGKQTVEGKTIQNWGASQNRKKAFVVLTLAQDQNYSTIYLQVHNVRYSWKEIFK